MHVVTAWVHTAAAWVHRAAACVHRATASTCCRIHVAWTTYGRTPRACHSCSTSCVSVLQNWAAGSTPPRTVPLTSAHSRLPVASRAPESWCFHRHAPVPCFQRKLSGPWSTRRRLFFSERCAVASRSSRSAPGRRPGGKKTMPMFMLSQHDGDASISRSCAGSSSTPAASASRRPPPPKPCRRRRPLRPLVASGAAPRSRPSVPNCASEETAKSSDGWRSSSSRKYGIGLRSHTASESDSSRRTPDSSRGST